MLLRLFLGSRLKKPFKSPSLQGFVPKFIQFRDRTWNEASEDVEHHARDGLGVALGNHQPELERFLFEGQRFRAEHGSVPCWREEEGRSRRLFSPQRWMLTALRQVLWEELEGNKFAKGPQNKDNYNTITII